MIHALKALKKDQDILLNAMKVFIQEPSLDWREQALKAKYSERDENQHVTGDLFTSIIFTQTRILKMIFFF